MKPKKIKKKKENESKEKIDYKTVQYLKHELNIKQYKTKLKKVKNHEELTKIQKKELLSFANSCIAQQISPKRVCKYLTYLTRFALMFGKSFKSTTRKDIEILWNTILLESKGRWSPDTVNDFKVTLKKYYKTMEGDGEEYPKKVRWIKCTGAKPHMQETYPELLISSDIEKMIESTNNHMWRTFIMVLWETGMRLYEILSLRIKDITVLDSGIKLRCRGKTGSREYPLLVECYSYLTQWLSQHPYGSDKDALVFINTSNNRKHRGLNSGGVHKMLKAIAKKANITKPIYPKAFRRSRATHLAKYLPEFALKKYMGWVANSKVASHYVFMSGAQLEDALKKMHGIPVEEDDKRKIIKCPRCFNIPPSGSNACNKCMMPLSIIAAESQKEKLEQLEQLMPFIDKLKEVEPMLKKMMGGELSEKRTS